MILTLKFQCEKTCRDFDTRHSDTLAAAVYPPWVLIPTCLTEVKVVGSELVLLHGARRNVLVTAR